MSLPSRINRIIASNHAMCFHCHGKSSKLVPTRHWIAKILLSLQLLVLAGGSSAEAQSRPRALFEPGPGRTMLVIGQDLGSIGGLALPYNNGYSNYISPVPGGATTYINLPGLGGMTTTMDTGAGKLNAQTILNGPTYSNSVLAIGVYMVGQEAAIAAGTHDAKIVTFANWIKSANRPVYLRIGYEFDGSWNNYNPANFKLAWKRIVNILRQQNVTNCATVWQACTSSFSSNKNRDLLEWYPGDDYVDWFGYSWFIQSSEQIQLTDKLVNLARAHGKPVMVCESAPQGYDTKNLTQRNVGNGGNSVSKTAQQIWNEWYAGFFSYIRQNRDSVRIVAYINANWDAQSMWGPPYSSGYWGDSRVENNAAIKSLWLQTVLGGGWLHSSAGLFQHLRTGLDASLPGLPLNLTAAATGTTSVQLNWKTPTLQELVAGYRVYWSTGSTKPAVEGASLPANATSYAVTGLASGTTYNFWVAAYNTAGETSATATARTVTIPPGPTVPLTGTVIGTPGSYANSQSTVDKVFDGNLATFFDAPVSSGAWAGLDLGTPKVVTQVAYCPRTSFANRMTGGVFQGSNSPDFSGAVTLFTVTSVPSVGTMTVQSSGSSTPFRYVRYLGPTNGWCNVAEIEFR